jgi:putative acetyltransferase
MFQIVEGELEDPRVVDLVRAHFTAARAQTAPGSAHALDLAGLRAPDVEFWTMWLSGDLVGMGALKRLTSELGEVKSMHTIASARRRGAGSSMLQHIIATAGTLGLARLSLETGSWDYFRPAREFYRRHGFVECPPFGDYVLDPNSIFMTLELKRP